VWYFPVKARGQEIRERNPEVCSYQDETPIRDKDGTRVGGGVPFRTASTVYSAQ